MRVTPTGSTSTAVSMLLAGRVGTSGNANLSWYPDTSCSGKLQNSKPSSEYPPAKPRMPCAEIYLFGCARSVDQTGRSGPSFDLSAEDVLAASCGKPSVPSRRSFTCRRGIETPGSWELLAAQRVHQIILLGTRTSSS